MGTFALTRRSREKLMIFARVPEAGRVKSRLAADVGDERALEIYRAMLADVLENIGSDPPFDVEVLWTGSREVDSSALQDAFGRYRLSMQIGDELGDRLSMAFAERFVFHDAEKVIAIGTDDPTLDRESVSHAFALLDSAEWVIGPASDGGYYLIGCRGRRWVPSVFRGIDWGTGRVLEQTLELIRARRDSLALLPERTDVDRIDDLRAIRDRLDGSSRVARLLDRMEE